jgi:plasmid stability protein
MPTTLTLKAVPDEVYRRLKALAEIHRRSLNSEALVCLETALLPRTVSPAERLARAQALRAALPSGSGSPVPASATIMPRGSTAMLRPR